MVDYSYSLLKYVSGHIVKSQWKPSWTCLLSHLENACCKGTVLRGYEKTFYSPSEVPEIQLFYAYGSHGKSEVISVGDLSGQGHESLLRKNKKKRKKIPPIVLIGCHKKETSFYSLSTSTHSVSFVQSVNQSNVANYKHGLQIRFGVHFWC